MLSRSVLVRAVLQPGNRATSMLAAAAKRDDNNKWLDVKWSDGKEGRFPYVWLRDNCPAAHSYHVTAFSKARLVKMHQLDLNVKPVSVEPEEKGIKIVWEEGKSALYSHKWLRDRNPSDPKVKEQRPSIMLPNKRVWNRELFNKHFKFYDFEKVLSDDMTCHDALTALVEWGLVFFNNLRPEEDQQLRLSKHLGFHYKTHYGDTFHVRFKADPTNVGNETNEELELHTDHPYQEVPPDIQMLHCIKNFGFGDGGESVFSDGFNAARIIQRDRPDLYRVLCDTKIEYIDEGVDFIPFDAVAKFPLINFDDKGTMTRIVFSNHMRSWFLELKPEEIGTFYEAIKLFRNTVHDDANSFKIQLQPGQMVAFDNNRVLHGRTSFQVTPETQRHLQGIFFSWDCVKSRIRVLRDRYNLEPNPVTISY